MAHYRITFTVEARDKADAIHWAQWVAGFESVMRNVDVESVVRFAGSLPEYRNPACQNIDPGPAGP